MENGKSRWEGERRKIGRGSDDEQCGEIGSKKRAGENLSCAELGWDGWPASFCGVNTLALAD